MNVALKGAAKGLRTAIKRGCPVVALTGAGVSAESGIPTFRGAGGLWQGYRAEELATPEAFQRDPAKVWEWYHWRRGLVLEAQPNPAHEALAELERVHEPFTLITQNVDGLHQRAGSRRVVELHGNIHHARCTVCEHVVPLGEHTRDHPDEDGDGPGADSSGAHGPAADSSRAVEPGLVACARCGARARPHIVWFGEVLPEQPWQEAHVAAASAAVLLVVGTSAAVYPAAGLVDVTAAAGGAVVEINPEQTALSSRATFSLREPAGVALPTLLRGAGIVS